MLIKVYGMYCGMYDELLKNVRAATKSEKYKNKVKVVEVTNRNELLAQGVTRYPSLGIDDKIISKGKVHTEDEICELIDKGDNAYEK